MKKTPLLLTIFYIIPPLIYFSDKSNQYFSNALWFIYVIPTLFIVFYKGLKFGWITIGIGSFIFLLTELSPSERLGAQNFITFTELLLVNFLITVCVGILVKQNQKKQELEQSLIESEERYKFLAYHDRLTSLPNMNYLNSQILQELNHAKSANMPSCLMFFNLDRFKLINDSFGHRSGDQILRMTARRLMELVDTDGTVIRAGADDFIIYLPNFNSLQAKEFAEYLLQSFSEPFQLYNQEIRIGASIGIAMLKQEETLEGLVQEASAALHVAKEYGGNRYQLFSTDFRQKANRKLQVDQQLRKALEQKGLEIYYQPKLDLFTNKVTGMEALARWTDPVLGVVSPGEFIPVAEETGLISLIGEWVLETACKQNMEYIRNGYPPLHVCVNISSKQFLQENFISMVEQILAESGLAPEYLNLEITESIALYNVKDAIEKLKKLKQLGVSISLDDFGTGYSSLSYIKSLPIDVLKIDRSFIIDIIESKQDEAIIHSVISLAHSLGLTVVAEGVETEHQLNMLGNLSCDEIQGYFYAKPMSSPEFEQFLRVYKEKVLIGGPVVAEIETPG